MHADHASAFHHPLPTYRQREQAIPARVPSRQSRPTQASGTTERGTALIFALVMLLLLTILGITAITTSSLQEKMAGNMHDQYTAQQAADSILRDAEALVFNQAKRPTPSCPPNTAVTQRIWDGTRTGGGCLVDFTTVNDSWWNTNGFTASFSTSYAAQEPRYVVELIQRVPMDPSRTPKVYRYYYRTTGWSAGFTDSARGLLQSVFSKKSDDYQ